MNPRMTQYAPLVAIFLRYEIEAPIIVREYDAIIAKGEELRSAITSHWVR